MIHTDYKIEALHILLCRDCLAERYYPLIPYKDVLVSGLLQSGCKTKCGAEALSDSAFIKMEIDDAGIIILFRRFLKLYDPSPAKLREIEKVSNDPEEQAAFRELYFLPGVKSVRAALYYRSGYKTLADFAETTVDEVLKRTAAAISEYKMACIVPLPKEVRTHIAVSKAFTME